MSSIKSRLNTLEMKRMLNQYQRKKQIKSRTILIFMLKKETMIYGQS